MRGVARRWRYAVGRHHGSDGHNPRDGHQSCVDHRFKPNAPAIYVPLGFMPAAR